MLLKQPRSHQALRIEDAKLKPGFAKQTHWNLIPHRHASKVGSGSKTMDTIIKDILAIMAGVFLGALTVMAIQMTGHHFYPLPDNIDPESVESITAHMTDVSIGAMLFVLLAWFLGAFTGVLLAIKAAPIRKKMAGGLVGFIQWLMAIQTLNMLPHPMWMTVAGVLAAPLATFIAFMLVGPQPDEET